MANAVFVSGLFEPAPRIRPVRSPSLSVGRCSMQPGDLSFITGTLEVEDISAHPTEHQQGSYGNNCIGKQPKRESSQTAVTHSPLSELLCITVNAVVNFGVIRFAKCKRRKSLFITLGDVTGFESTDNINFGRIRRPSLHAPFIPSVTLNIVGRDLLAFGLSLRNIIRANLLLLTL